MPLVWAPPLPAAPAPRSAAVALSIRDRVYRHYLQPPGSLGSRADARNLAPKAVKYLAAAGREALAKYANREAANYLSAALALIESGEPGEDERISSRLIEDLARARQRLGEYEAAQTLLARMYAVRVPK